MPSVQLIQAHPWAYLGPTIVSMIIQALEMGVLLQHSVSFWTRSHREKMPVNLIVAFVSLVALLQTALIFYTTSDKYVTHFGDWSLVVHQEWPEKIQALLTVCMAAPVQGFLIWRCWMLTKRKWLFLVPMMAILVAYIIISLYVTQKVLPMNFKVSSTSSGALHHKIKIDPSFVLSLLLPAVLDIFITTTLLSYFVRSQSYIFTSHFRRVINRLITITWESALPPSCCAVIAFVTYVTTVNVSFWDLTFQAILGKLYVLSLFVTLNGRAELTKPTCRCTANGTPLTDLTFTTPRICVDMSPWAGDLEHTRHSTSAHPRSIVDPEASHPAISKYEDFSTAQLSE
ncbi:hypothetical protein JAAARDRAFT_427087 [Jaapia argillacea MUCL 33604]|uniref:DUF6534 domain-containing protein n=1 Tax=Jaapia argillacea MUCL 33604 TaxID=933084 RepID=A0A067PQD4_9AGAM|nr:hypothetical protein JAAARDRAFT_427087 [Jaapia argillacea MUCL 33604]